MITRLGEIIKGLESFIFTIIASMLFVVFLAGFFIFLETNQPKPSIRLENGAFLINFSDEEESRREVFFVASKNGTKYYPINCTSANRIKEENKIFFASEDEAKKAGFERTVTCK